MRHDRRGFPLFRLGAHPGDVMTGLTVLQASARLGMTRQGVHWLISQGRIRKVQAVSQPRDDSGRFFGAGVLLDPGDVAREAERRNR